VRISKVLLPCIMGVALSAAASAEVYESKDAQGNTVFSDMPSQGAEKVKVPPTNAADPIAITPGPEPSPETPAKPKKSSVRPDSSEQRDTDDEYPDDDYLYYGDNDDDDQTRREKRRDEDAKPKRERPIKLTPPRNVSRPAGGVGRR
jgi:Domain of unknown function (DUF4124)